MGGLNTIAWNRIRYTAYAPFYDWIVSFARQRRRAIELLDLQPGERVLIVGCGTGLDLEHVPQGVEILAIDLTPAMVERTRARARTLGREIRVMEMDAQHLRIPDGTYDAAILHLILAVAPDPKAIAREVARVLVPRGRAVVFDKFVPDTGRISSIRRLANLASNTLVTDITRRLGSILENSGLEVVHREPAWLGGAYEIALLRKGA